MHQESARQDRARPAPAALPHHRDGPGLPAARRRGRLARAGGLKGASPRAATQESDTTSFAEWLRQLMGMMKERCPGFCGRSGFSPDSTLGTEMTKSRPKSRRALPEMVLATSPTRSRIVSWLKSFSCIFISSTVSMALGAVKYTTPSRLPEMLMRPVYSCTEGEPSIRYGEPIEAGCWAATSKKFVVPSTKVLSSCSYSMGVEFLL